MRLLLIAAPFLLSAALVQAQPAPHDFEVASIHMVASGHTAEELSKGIGAAYVSPYGTNKFTARNVPLEFLIGIAYGVDYNRLTAKDEWLDTQLYDVVAEVDPAIKLTREQTQPLLRHLLEGRFHLKTHTEQVQVSGYALVVAPGGPKLTPSSQTEPHAQLLPNALQASGVPMKSVAAFLERPAGLPVVDETGLAGLYDIKLSYAPGNSTDSTLPSIFTALKEQLGLKLQPKKITVQQLVVDHVEKVPEAN
jgi:uncharacterized protein (TIGR03435 family)